MIGQPYNVQATVKRLAYTLFYTSGVVSTLDVIILGFAGDSEN